MAINPATPVYVLDEVLDYIDGINLLMVNPGFAGQKMVPSTMKKASKVIELLKRTGKTDVVLEADGNITPENGHKLHEMGVNMFVCGSSAIFKGDLREYKKNISYFRDVIR